MLLIVQHSYNFNYGSRYLSHGANDTRIISKCRLHGKHLVTALRMWTTDQLLWPVVNSDEAQCLLPVPGFCLSVFGFCLPRVWFQCFPVFGFCVPVFGFCVPVFGFCVPVCVSIYICVCVCVMLLPVSMCTYVF